MVMFRECQDKFACLELTLIACVQWTEIKKKRESSRVKKKRRLNPINGNDLMIRISTLRMMITALHFQSINIQLREWRTNKSEDLWHDNRFCICCPAFPSRPSQRRPIREKLRLKRPFTVHTIEGYIKRNTMKARNPFGAVRVSNHIILFIARHHQHSHCRTREKSFTFLALPLMYKRREEH